MSSRGAPLLLPTTAKPKLRGPHTGGAWAPGSLQQGMDGGDKGDLVSWLWRGISYNALAWVPLAGASVFAVCIGVHAAASLLARRKFEALGLEQRLVTYTHLAFAVVFSLQLVPYTVLAIRFLFRRWCVSCNCLVNAVARLALSGAAMRTQWPG